MSTKTSLNPNLQTILQSALPQHHRSSLRQSVIPALLDAISNIAKTLQTSHQVSLAGSANSFGDDQLNVDVSAESHIRQALSQCPSVVTASSEEDPREVKVNSSPLSGEEERYTVAFDPLDGSSIIGPNWSVGTIIGVWDGESALGVRPREKQIAAILGVLGPRTTAVVAVRVAGGEGVCFEVGFEQDTGVIDVTRPVVSLGTGPFNTRYFAPANLRAAATNQKYMDLVTGYVKDKYTLRYSGGLVPDVVHALVKGHGVYVSPVGEGGKGAKLRRLYELCPVALIVECAGGRAVDPVDGSDMLDRILGGTDERGGIVCGNVEEVERVKNALVG